MVFRRRRPARRARPVRRIRKMRSAKRFNPSPIFTESYVDTHHLSVNSGFLLTTNIGKLSQVSQYSQLYTKYKILRAKWMLLPYYSAGSSDQNANSFNNGAGQPFTADARVVYSIQDSPAQITPLNENQVLQDNGCKVKMVKNKLVISAKVVPDLQLANGIYETQRSSPFINFDTTGGAPPAHYGVVGWITQPVSGAPPMAQQYVVYCKLTFQLKDPR